MRRKRTAMPGALAQLIAEMANAGRRFASWRHGDGGEIGGSCEVALRDRKWST
jgi:hypothetical protein